MDDQPAFMADKWFAYVENIIMNIFHFIMLSNTNTAKEKEQGNGIALKQVRETNRLNNCVMWNVENGIPTGAIYRKLCI